MKSAFMSLTFLLLAACAWALPPAITSAAPDPQVIPPAPAASPLDLAALFAPASTPAPVTPVEGNLPGRSPEPLFMGCMATSQYNCSTPGGGTEGHVSCIGNNVCYSFEYHVVCDGVYTYCSCWFDFGGEDCACGCYAAGGTGLQCRQECSP